MDVSSPITEPSKPPRDFFDLPRTTATQFFDFVRERGVAGFATGFILGGAVGKIAQSLTDDIINPAAGIFLGPVKDLSAYAIGAFKIGDFISTLINFLVVCFVMFMLFKMLRLDIVDKSKK